MRNKKVLHDWFKRKFDLKDDFKLILFRNPKEFKKFELERVNPNHKILIWGLPSKKNQRSKHLHYIKVGKILLNGFIPIFSIMILNTNIGILNVNYFFFSYLLNKVLFFVIDNYSNEGLKNVNRNRRGIRWGKNLTIG